MATPVKFTVTINDDGTQEIKVPPGVNQQASAGKLSSFTEKLANLIGRIKERHIGKPLDNHTHVHQDGSVHQNH